MQNQTDGPAGRPFDYETRTWGHEDRRVSAPGLPRLKLERAVAALHDCRGTVLDLGCGGGMMQRGLARARPDLDLVGCDVSAAALNANRQAAAQARLPAPRLLQAALDALPFAAATFDGAVCLDVLEHLPDPAAALREAGRVLKPNAPLHLHVPIEGTPGSAFWLWERLSPRARRGISRRVSGHLHVFTASHLLEHLAGAGFAVRKLEYSYHLAGQARLLLGYLAQDRGIRMPGGAYGRAVPPRRSLRRALVLGPYVTLNALGYVESRLLHAWPFAMGLDVTAARRGDGG